ALAETPDPAAIAGDEEERRDAGVAGGEPARGRELPDPERYRWPDPEAWQVSRRDLGRELGCRAPGRGAGHEQALDEGCGRRGRWPEASHVHEQEAVAAIGMRDPVGEAAGDAAAGTVREGQLVLEDVRTAVGKLRARGPGARRHQVIEMLVSQDAAVMPLDRIGHGRRKTLDRDPVLFREPHVRDEARQVEHSQWTVGGQEGD